MSRWLDEPLDWLALRDALIVEIEAATEIACARRPERTPIAVVLDDLHTTGMLVLWPYITVVFAEPGVEDVIVEGSRHGDHLAARVTATGGIGGSSWDEVFGAYVATVGAACAAAQPGLRVRFDSPTLTCVVQDRAHDESSEPGVEDRATDVELRDALHHGDPRDRSRAARAMIRRGNLAVVVDDLIGRGDDIDEALLLEALTEAYLGETKWEPLDYAPLEAALRVRPGIHEALRSKLSCARLFEIDAGDIATAQDAMASSLPVVREHAAIVMLSIHL